MIPAGGSAAEGGAPTVLPALVLGGEPHPHGSVGAHMYAKRQSRCPNRRWPMRGRPQELPQLVPRPSAQREKPHRRPEANNHNI